MPKTWRAEAAPIIYRVLEQTRGQDEKQIRKALRQAYPFGPRKHWPYKVWLDEIKVQRGKKRPGPRRKSHDPNQLKLDL